MTLPAHRIRHYPKLSPDNHKKTSEETEGKVIKYNCVSWSLGITDKWIDNTKFDESIYWPEEVPITGKLLDYTNLFKHYGFEESIMLDTSVEQNWTKIAIYLNDKGEFSHVSIQRVDGRWSSKLGDWEDICHDSLESLSDYYGEVKLIMKKLKK